MRQYIGAVRAENNILSPLCLFVETMPIKKAGASGNGNRFFTQKLYVQFANKPQAQLLSPFQPTSFFITIYL